MTTITTTLLDGGAPTTSSPDRAEPVGAPREQFRDELERAMRRTDPGTRRASDHRDRPDRAERPDHGDGRERSERPEPPTRRDRPGRPERRSEHTSSTDPVDARSLEEQHGADEADAVEADADVHGPDDETPTDGTDGAVAEPGTPLIAHDLRSTRTSASQEAVESGDAAATGAAAALGDEALGAAGTAPGATADDTAALGAEGAASATTTDATTTDGATAGAPVLHGDADPVAAGSGASTPTAVGTAAASPAAVADAAAAPTASAAPTTPTTSTASTSAVVGEQAGPATSPATETPAPVRATDGMAAAPAAGAERLLAPAPTTPAAESRRATEPAPMVDLQRAVEISELGDRLGAVLRRGTRVQTLSVQLHPAELGAVKVEARLVDGVTHLVFSPESGAAGERLASTLHDLRQQMSRAGVQVGDLDVRQGPSDGSSHGQAPGTDETAERGRTGHLAPSGGRRGAVTVPHALDAPTTTGAHIALDL